MSQRRTYLPGLLLLGLAMFVWSLLTGCGGKPPEADTKGYYEGSSVTKGQSGIPAGGGTTAPAKTGQ